MDRGENLRRQMMIINEYFDSKYSQPFTLEISWTKQKVIFRKGVRMLVIYFDDIPELREMKRREKI